MDGPILNGTSFSSFNSTGHITTKLALCSNGLSIVGGVLIIYLYVKIPNLWQSTPRKFLVYITYADLMQSLGYIIGSIRTEDLFVDVANLPLWLQSDTLCRTQSFMTTYASIASFLWTDILAFFLFYVVVFEGGSDLSTRVNIIIHFIGWFIPGKCYF